MSDKSLISFAFRQFHFHGDFRGENLQFCTLAVRKNTRKYLQEMRSKWEQTRTAGSDLPSARFGLCLKKSIFVSKNCSELFRNIQKFPSLLRKDCGRRALTIPRSRLEKS